MPEGAINVTPAQAAEITGFSLDKMYEALHAGRIPHQRNGVRFLIPRELLLKWAEQEALSNTRAGSRRGGRR